MALGASDPSGCWGRAEGPQSLVTNPLGYPFALKATLLSQADKVCTDVPEKTKQKEHVVAALRVSLTAIAII